MTRASLRQRAVRLRRRARFEREFRRFREAARDDHRFPLPEAHERDAYLYDDLPLTSDPHYLYHPAWAARILAKTMPDRHVDVSSWLAWVVTVSAFVPVDYYEYRVPGILELEGLRAHAGDVSALPFADASVASLSCMHTVEHVGLGRYGDPLDPLADSRAMAELQRVLARGGNLLFVVPVGRPKVAFNGQRVYSPGLVAEAFDELTIAEFSLILEDGSGILTGEEALAAAADQTNACGCWWLRRP